MRSTLPLSLLSLITVTHVVIVTLAIGMAGTAPSAAHAMAAQPATAPLSIRIIVIAGEDAVNVVQQKTATAPIVEVRDRNNQPVAGAIVTFAIQGGRASFNGARILTVTTDLAGRAAVSGLTPTASGALQISASAAFQGQTAVVAIAQTNVMTAAQAAAVASAGGASGSTGAAAGAGAATGGGGLSLTTIGLVAGAVAGGTIAAKQVVGAGGGVSIYEGDFRIDTVLTVQQIQPNGVITLNCTAALSQNGEVRAEIEEREDGTLIGTMSAKWSITELSRTCPTSSAASDISYGQATVTGTTAGFQASSSTSPDPRQTQFQSFSGTLANGVITGTWTLGPYSFKSDNGGGQSSPAGSVAVRLTK